MADVDDIKAVKTKRNTLREKLEKRKKERQIGSKFDEDLQNVTKLVPETDVEKSILRVLSSNSLVLPVISTQLIEKIEKAPRNLNKPPALEMINYILRKLATSGAIGIKSVTIGRDSGCEVIAVESEILKEMYQDHLSNCGSSINEELKRTGERCVIEYKLVYDFKLKIHVADAVNDFDDGCQSPKMSKLEANSLRSKEANSTANNNDASNDIMSLLSMPSTREKQSKQVGEEILELLTKPTAKERSVAEKFKSHGGAQVMEFCPHGTKIECLKAQQATAEMAAKKKREHHLLPKNCKEETNIQDATVTTNNDIVSNEEPEQTIGTPINVSALVQSEAAAIDSGTEDGEIVTENVKDDEGEESQQSIVDDSVDATSVSALDTCTKLHFKKIIQSHTDESLGDCSFLNTCFHMQTCKYVHYEVDTLPNINTNKPADVKTKLHFFSHLKEHITLYPPQWIQCDLRFLDMTVLGKFAVVMADPPWDIHMELPYGTMSDDEMRQLGVPALQDDGLIFLWVTGRAMELGRECLKLWGYERVDELIWVKTNQLQRIIRTGRTGHWLNHGKEHCLIGMKGNPTNLNRGLDCDVIVAEVRATSHKPDEIYGIIERLSPGTRKIELFGRPHNVQPNWITLGNQLDGIRLVDPELITQFQKRYPDGNCMSPVAATNVGNISASTTSANPAGTVPIKK